VAEFAQLSRHPLRLASLNANQSFRSGRKKREEGVTLWVKGISS